MLKKLFHTRISGPDRYTLLRMVLTPVFVVLFFMRQPWAAGASFLVFTAAALTDWLDGYMARKMGRVTRWGQFLDPLADKILIASAFICFCVIGLIPVWMVALIIFRDFLITGLRSYALYKEKPIATSFLAKSKTFIQMVILYLIFISYLLFFRNPSQPPHFLAERIQNLHLFTVSMWVILIFTLFTGVDYFIKNRQHISMMRAELIRLFHPQNDNV